MNQDYAKVSRNLISYWEQKSKHADDVVKYINACKNFISKDNLVILSLPLEASYKALEKTISALKDLHFESFEEMLKIEIATNHESCFVLARHGSSFQLYYEQLQKEKGGLNSAEIHDFGEVRIAEVDEKNCIIKLADFTFYRMKSAFVI
mgnify:FL=1